MARASVLGKPSSVGRVAGGDVSVACDRTIRVLWLAVAFLSIVLAGATTRAQAPPVDRESKDPVSEGAAVGAYLPYASNASLTAYRAMVSLDAGYDGVRHGSDGRLRGEVVLLGKRERRWSNVNLSIFGGGGYSAADLPKSPPAYGYGGLKLQPLVQTVHGVDLTASLRYTSRGFNLLPAVVTDVVLGKQFGKLTTLFHAAYGQATRDEDRFGSLGASALVRILEPLFAGIDVQVSADLELDQEEPAYEPELEAIATSVMSYAIAYVTLTGHAGLRCLRYRSAPELMVGPEFGVSASTAL